MRARGWQFGSTLNVEQFSEFLVKASRYKKSQVLDHDPYILNRNLFAQTPALRWLLDVVSASRAITVLKNGNFINSRVNSRSHTRTL